MRVNIVGKGVCPVLGVILPVINTEVSEGVLVTILKTRNIRVFDTISGVQITLRNYKNFLMRRTVAAVAQTAAPIEPVKVPATKVEKKKKSTKKQADEAPATVEAVPETVPEETKSETVETTSEPIVVETVPEISEDSVDTTSETTNETTASSTDTDTTESTNNYSSKKKKRK